MRWLTVLFVFVCCYTGCTSKPAASGPGESAPAGVTVQKPERKTIHWTIEQPGSILAYEQAPIVAKLPGYVSKMYVDIDDKVVGPQRNWFGDRVREGTLLAELSIPEIEEEAKQKEAQAVQARAEVDLARKNLVVAEANVTSAHAMTAESIAAEKQARADYDRWQSESTRIDGLVKRGTIDKQASEETRNQFLSAEGAWEKAKAHIESAQACEKESKAKKERAEVEIVTAQARQSAAEADARKLMALRQYTQIRAPFDGIVTGRYVHTGHFLQPGSTNDMKPLFTVSRIDPVRISVEVPELAAALIEKDKSEGRVRIQGLRGMEFKGLVKRTSWALNPEARTLRIEIELRNPKGTIRPGMYATATIDVELVNATVIPMSALSYRDEQAFCFIAEDGKAVEYEVQLGRTDGESMELLQKRKTVGNHIWEPIKGTEGVIVKRDGAIVDGQKVIVR
jgi:RND family efflux transporter MFP subunit